MGWQLPTRHKERTVSELEEYRNQKLAEREQHTAAKRAVRPQLLKKQAAVDKKRKAAIKKKEDAAKAGG
jgi:hypothetical protein